VVDEVQDPEGLAIPLVSEMNDWLEVHSPTVPEAELSQAPQSGKSTSFLFILFPSFFLF